MSDSSTDQDSSRNQNSNTDKGILDLDTLFKRADDIVATSVIGRPKRGSGYVPKIDAKIRLNVEVMDWLKTKAPFWKLEDTPDGGKWVDARDTDAAATARWVKADSPVPTDPEAME